MFYSLHVFEVEVVVAVVVVVVYKTKAFSTCKIITRQCTSKITIMNGNFMTFH